jgi:hypothetical protein
MNQHVAKVERIDPETGEITEVSLPASEPTQIEVPAAEAEPKNAVAKRTLPLQPVLQEQEPSLPTPDADRIDPKWDIAQVATRGHVHIERFFVLSEKLFWPSIMLGLLSVLLIVQNMPGLAVNSQMINVAFWGILGAGLFLLIVWGSGSALSEYGESAGPALAFGSFIIGGGLWTASWFAQQYPFGVMAWIAFGVKICCGLAILWFVVKHAIKSFRSSESRAILWMGGGYIAVVLVLSALASSLASNSNFFVQAAQSALTFDEDTYWNLGGGLRGGADLAWMADHAPQPGGLTNAEHAGLIKAVQSDLAKFGTDATQWEAVAALPKSPIITRAEKAIRDYAAKLPIGIVVVPENRPVMKLIAHVEGQWSLTLINDRSCAVFLGPWSEETGCSNETNPQDPLNGYARGELFELKPIPVAETKE